MRILITTGDRDGIGWEITTKALNLIGPRSNVQFVFFRGPVKGPRLNSRFKTESVVTLAEALNVPISRAKAVEIKSALAPARWVEDGAEACLKGHFNALVTAPLSKTSIVASGLKDIGHTEILKRVTGCSDLFMGFIGSKFNVVLATGHLPLSKAISSLNLTLLAKAVNAACELKTILPGGRSRLPIAIVGVNPHAGEDGLLGQEEGWMRGFIEDQAAQGKKLLGPLVPDTAFLPKNWPLYSTYVCPYHDQGLLPFKMVHGFKSGVHLTLGLPFVRTSVDHGTAKDLYKKNKAEAGSMRDAILTAIRLAKERL